MKRSSLSFLGFILLLHNLLLSQKVRLKFWIIITNHYYMIETVILFPTYIHVSYVVASKFQVLG